MLHVIKISSISFLDWFLQFEVLVLLRSVAASLGDCCSTLRNSEVVSKRRTPIAQQSGATYQKNEDICYTVTKA
jgi:hypothetical protein